MVERFVHSGAARGLMTNGMKVICAPPDNIMVIGAMRMRRVNAVNVNIITQRFGCVSQRLRHTSQKPFRAI